MAARTGKGALLFGLIEKDKALAAQARAIAQERRAVKQHIEVAIAHLAAGEGGKFEKKDYSCGCVVINGVVWRDCKVASVTVGRGRDAYPYEFEQNEKARAAGKKLPYPQFDEQGRALPKEKTPCMRRGGKET